MLNKVLLKELFYTVLKNSNLSGLAIFKCFFFFYLLEKVSNPSTGQNPELLFKRVL